MNYKQFFKGKKITVMGLGLLGGATGDIAFLAKCGADLIVTDLKPSTALRSSLSKLRTYKNIKYVLGEHRVEDFRNADIILEPGNVPKDSVYLKEAIKNNIPIHVSESLFAEYAQGVVMVGITGTRGKSMTTMLVYEILKQNLKNKNVWLGGNVRGVSTLALLDKVREGDIVVLELDSWALHGMGHTHKSPDIAVFTSFMSDHMNYYKSDMDAYFADKANIFKYQKEGDVLVIGETMQKLIKKKDTKGKFIVAKSEDVAGWQFTVPGEHNRANLACAVAVAKALDIPTLKIKKAVANFKGVEGRLQLLRTYKGIKIYNDNNATTPEATIAGLKALALLFRQDLKSGNLILICGGATKKVPLEDFVKALNKYPKKVFLIPGTGTDELLSKKLKIEIYKAKDFKDAVLSAVKSAKRGDTVLFSPAFASFGLFNNEYERNDLFVKIIKGLK